MSSESVLRVVVPARLGSERLSRKPLAPIGGVPMVQRVAMVAEKALPDVQVIIAADSEVIADALRGSGFRCLLTSASHQSGTDRIAEVASKLSWRDDDFVINLQGDEPLIPTDLVASFAQFCQSGDVPPSMATVAVPIESDQELLDENVVKVVSSRKDRALYFSRAALPYTRGGTAVGGDLTPYRRHVGIYGYDVRTLLAISSSPECFLEKHERLEQLRALYLDIDIAIMSWHAVPPAGVDTARDLERVRSIFEATGDGCDNEH